ncbi:MAG: flagellar FlbD family protein [Syntrophomonadaceae bacterium]|nr:flagellar FlbD family protein [Syntrophomonadaceae bacterium]
MIELTRINGQKMVINSELIETLEATPDTVITLTTGKKFVVCEKPEQIVSGVIRFKKLINNLKS